jgi:4'-phosphopantetheinyl transferase
VLTADLTTVEIDESILSVGELGCALEFAMTSKLRPYLAAHTWLRQRLGEYLDCPADEIEFAPGGQLRILSPDTDLSFDLSYADGIVALAVGFRIPVGVNVEAVAPDPVDTDTVRRVLTRPEANAVFASNDMRKEFSKLWSRKQALASAMERDLDDEAKSMSVLGL